jgi:S1-C subfamily serine protease
MEIAMRQPSARPVSANTLAVIVSLALAALPCRASARQGPLPADSLEVLAERATQAVVLLDVQTDAGPRQGSGFLVDAEGRLITNYHVVRGAQSIRIKLSAGDLYDAATILATDERRDIAVLQIAGFGLPALPLGNSDSVRVGSSVVVIGSPMGLENTVTTGIVSGRRQEPEGYQLLQISAPASHGSSGGPVLSRRGEVIGIASSQLQAGQNLNFAVPINYARGLLTQSTTPVAVLRPVGSAPGTTTPLASAVPGANSGLSYALERFAGYILETEAKSGEEQSFRKRVTYRLIQTVGSGEPRIERYFESETTRRTGPFDTNQTVRRERSRTLVRADGLQPISSSGEIAWWTGDNWRTAQYDLTFDGYHVRGTVADTTGKARELDRDLPQGVILREVTDLAFATLAADSLSGRSVEFVTFDSQSGELVRDRYDVGGVETLRVAGRNQSALRVNVASGLSNTTAYFTVSRPRVLLRHEIGDLVEELTRLEVFTR